MKTPTKALLAGAANIAEAAVAERDEALGRLELTLEYVVWAAQHAYSASDRDRARAVLERLRRRGLEVELGD